MVSSPRPSPAVAEELDAGDATLRSDAVAVIATRRRRRTALPLRPADVMLTAGQR